MGGVERYNARLVARRFKQNASIDYFQIYSPMVKHVNMRLVFNPEVFNRLILIMYFSMVSLRKQFTFLSLKDLRMSLNLIMFASCLKLYKTSNKLQRPGMIHSKAFFHIWFP